MKVRSLIAALGFALTASGCATDGAPVGAAPDGTPVYGRSFTPTEGDAAVTLNCAIVDGRRLVDCRIVREQPKGKGYGARALAMVDKPDAHLNGYSAAGSRIEFTISIRED